MSLPPPDMVTAIGRELSSFTGSLGAVIIILYLIDRLCKLGEIWIRAQAGQLPPPQDPITGPKPIILRRSLRASSAEGPGTPPPEDSTT